MLLGAALGFALMQNVRRFTYLLITGAALAVLPQALTLFFTGALSDSQIGVLSSVATALIAAFGAAIIVDVMKTSHAS
jgi:hypothetical protein